MKWKNNVINVSNYTNVEWEGDKKMFDISISLDPLSVCVFLMWLCSSALLLLLLLLLVASFGITEILNSNVTEISDSNITELLNLNVRKAQKESDIFEKFSTFFDTFGIFGQSDFPWIFKCQKTVGSTKKISINKILQCPTSESFSNFSSPQIHSIPDHITEFLMNVIAACERNQVFLSFYFFIIRLIVPKNISFSYNSRRQCKMLSFLLVNWYFFTLFRIYCASFMFFSH